MGEKKRPYRPPRLVHYGDLFKLTGAKEGGASDGSGKPNTKSSGAQA